MPQHLRPALFLDRDGVINEEVGYLHRFEDVRFVSGAAALIRTANDLGLPVIVITNQAGIGRGLYTESEFHTLMHDMGDALAQQNARLDGVYFSPFHPEHGLGPYRQDTECRKPKPGMLLRAAAEHNLDLVRSVLVGDRCTDIQAGVAAGLRHLFLLPGTEPDPCPGVPYVSALDLLAVTQWLQAHFADLTAPAAATYAASSASACTPTNDREASHAVTP